MDELPGHVVRGFSNEAPTLPGLYICADCAAFLPRTRRVAIERDPDGSLVALMPDRLDDPANAPLHRIQLANLDRRCAWSGPIISSDLDEEC